MITINSQAVLLHTKKQIQTFTTQLKSLAINLTLQIKTEHINTILDWSKSSIQIYNFPDIGCMLNAAIKGQPPTPHILSEAEIAQAKQRKNIHRVGKTFEPYTRVKQAALRIVGIEQVPDDQLLPLDHHYDAPRQTLYYK